MTTTYPVCVVGIGADGWAGLNSSARQAISECHVLVGSSRQLALIPPGNAERTRWPSPMLPALPGLFEQYAGRRVCVLASGDPMFHGIGVTLSRLLGRDNIVVLPHPSSAALACAKLGWPVADTTVVSLVGRAVETLLPELVDGTAVLVLSNDADTPAAVAKLLSANGYGPSAMTVLEQLGGPAERVVAATADAWSGQSIDPLNVIAVECVAAVGSQRLTRVPGLPDAVFSGDGQLTKQEVRALTLCALAPAPGELLWDVGGGSGSIAIEWMRTDRRCRATTFERVPARIEQIRDNARALGVPKVEILGEAPAAFDSAATPDAIFVGGGASQDGLLDECMRRLRKGGRLVANAVTAETEAILLRAAATHGGSLRRFQIYRGEPLGDFTSWRPQLPITQWTVVKPL